MLRPDRVESSMPHQPCLKNIDLFCRDVLPHLEAGEIPEWGEIILPMPARSATTCQPFG
jgi:hypothetical protein